MQDVPVNFFLDGKVELRPGDCREVIKAMPDASVDSVVTDPPYALVSIVKRFGGPNAVPASDGDVYARASSGFMGKQWDTGETAFAAEFWTEVLRVLKPGGHVVAFSGTRTYHRMAVAIEDAGFEIRDQLAWVYGSGFPKSHDVAKQLDKSAGHWRGMAGAVKDETVGQVAKGTEYERTDKGEPITPIAKQWQGWGTALKPAWEPICLARKPLIGTVAANVLEHGTGALNISACRVPSGASHTNPNDNRACTCSLPTDDQTSRIEDINSQALSALEPLKKNAPPTNGEEYVIGRQSPEGSHPGCHPSGRSDDEPARLAKVADLASSQPSGDEHKSRDRCATCGGIRDYLSTPYDTIPNIEKMGRWPANIVHDGSDEVLAAFPDTSASAVRRPSGKDDRGVPGFVMRRHDTVERGIDDAGGSASRFFYTAKADAIDRLGSKHPTVKPVDLMQWLVRLVTPKGGLVLDPFAGSGSTGEAAWREGMRCVLIEREEEYQNDIRKRMSLAFSSNETRWRESNLRKMVAREDDIFK